MERAFLLQVLDYADPYNLGGASRVALSLGKALNAFGLRSLIFAGCEGKRGWGSDGFSEVCFFPSLPTEKKTLSSNLRLLREPAKCYSAFFREEASFLLVHQPFVWWALRGLTGRSLPAYYFHSPWPEEYLVRARKSGRRPDPAQVLLRLALERWALRKARVIFTATHFVKSRLGLWHRSSKINAKVEVIGTGVDTEKFKPQGPKELLRKQLGLPLKKKILLTVRRLEERMGIDCLIRAFKSLKKRHEKLFLLIVGCGRLEVSLKKLVSELALREDVLFWGYASEEVLPKLYTASDLFILPTQALEGFGLVLLEASACGTPVVATPVGGIPEALKPLSVYFLSKGTDQEAIACAILKALSFRNLDSERLRKSVEASYSWKEVAIKLKESLLSLESKHGGGARSKPMGSRPSLSSNP